MKKEVTHNNVTIAYTVRSTKLAKRLSMRVEADGSVVVTKPARVALWRVDWMVQRQFAWILNAQQKMKQKPQKLLAHYSAKEYKEHKEEARKIVAERLKYFSKLYSFYSLRSSAPKLAIRNQKSRWGSCSGKGNLNFNYKIAFLPSELQDYIIVHELCHLKEMNHSQKFWDLVAEQIPDYKERRKKIQMF